MRKFLLSFALAACALGAEAQNTVEVSSLFSPSKAAFSDEACTSFSLDKAWDCKGTYSNWGNPQDLSRFAKVSAELTNKNDAKVYVQLVVEAKADDDSNVSDKGGIEIEAGETATLDVKLSNTHEGKVTQLYFQTDAPATIAIGKYYLTESSVWKLAKTLDMTESNWIEAKDFEDLPDDTRVVFTFNATGFSSEVNNWGVGEIADSKAQLKNGFCNVTREGANTAELTVADLKAILADAEDKGGLCWNTWSANKKDEVSCTISRVKIEFFTKVSTSLRPVTTDAEVVATDYFTLSGSKFSTPQKGINIVRRTLSDGTVQTDKVVIK